MKIFERLQVLSCSAWILATLIRIVFSKAEMRAILFSSALFSWGGATMVVEAAAVIDSVEIESQRNSKWPRLLIKGEIGEAVTIQYADNISSNSWKGLTNLVLSSVTYPFVDQAVIGVSKRFYRLGIPIEPPTNPSPAQLVWIPPGTFTMGSPAGEKDRFSWEGPQTVVTLTKGFFIGKYEVTQRDYLAVMGTNPSYFVKDRVLDFVPIAQRPPPLAENLNRPVEQVTWTNAVEYCLKLTQQERTAGRLPAGWEYRLPTEAEWEYACRAGTTTRFYHGDDPSYSELANYAWWSANSFNMTHAVGEKRPNAWGLYDMTGNVSEWCLDYYALFRGGSVTDPKGPSIGWSQVIRGGTWYNTHQHVRSAYRSYMFPEIAHTIVGFRVVLASATIN